MRLDGVPGRPHLTYGLNVHPGEDVPALLASLRAAAAVRTTLVDASGVGDRSVGDDGWMGVGLRLAGDAVRVLDRDPTALAAVRASLAAAHLYAFTANAFPHGAFHRARVKEAVYEPDWLDPRRAAYTVAAARVLAALVDERAEGVATVSTVPIAFAPRAEGSAARAHAGGLLRECAAELARLRDRTGVRVIVALEPEPACAAETTGEAIAFLEEHVMARGGASAREHLGVCVDLCHAAVLGEEPDEALAAPGRAGVELAKVQISAGVTAALPGREDPSAEERTLGALARFDDGVYLHQVVERAGGRRVAHVDLPDAVAALRAARAAGDDGARAWTMHAHVPVFLERAGELGTTQPWLSRALAVLGRRPVTSHLEVETYTWDVLPATARGASLTDDVARELAWARDRLIDAAAPRGERSR